MNSSNGGEEKNMLKLPGWYLQGEPFGKRTS